ncbi:MAG: fluoride efflux transporter CrcB [bacterium]|nr:fluoride efflux transporter CrcB [bacterium]
MRTELINLALVGGGGALGAMARYGLGGLVHRNAALAGFPFGTLAVNLLGCLLIGLGAGLADARQAFTPEARLFVFVGLLGGFTTFSSFGYETIALLRDHELLRAGLNVGINVFAGLALVWLGYALTAGPK